MKLINTATHHAFFKLLASTPSAQAAMMVLKPGQSSDDHPSNEHPRSDQWLYVISGAGKARINNRSVSLKPGHLLLIEKRELPGLIQITVVPEPTCLLIFAVTVLLISHRPRLR